MVLVWVRNEKFEEMSLNIQEGLSELGLIWLENFDRANVAVDNLRTCKMTAESIVGPAIVDTINL